MTRFPRAILSVWRIAALAGVLVWLWGGSLPVQARALPLAWVTSAGGWGEDIGYHIAVDAAGNSYVVGAFGHSATFGRGEAQETRLHQEWGGQHMFVAKYDRSG